MTNKRKHQLERIVRINFRNFNQIIYPKYVEFDLLEQITKLMYDSIWYSYYKGNTTLSETRFMIECVGKYYEYCKKQINKYFD